MKSSRRDAFDEQPVSVAVGLDELAARVDEFGGHAFLVTIGPEPRAHVVSTRVAWSDGRLVVTAGRRTRANLAAYPDIVVLWPGPPGAEFSLLVDGIVDEQGGADTDLSVRPVAAVLHRTATASPRRAH
jgi:hypothetical protein